MRLPIHRMLIWCALLGVSAAADPDALHAQSTDSADWLTIRPMLYFSNTDGEGFLGQSGLRIGMQDSVLSTNWAADLELRRRRLVLVLGAAYSTTANEAELRPGSAPLPYSFKLLTAEALAAYRFGPLNDAAEVLFLAGARYYAADQGLGDVEAIVDEKWVTPVVGVQGKIRAARKLSFAVRSDIGARFGRKSFSWSLRVGIDWQLLPVVGLAAQYRFLTLDQPIKPGEDFAFEGTSQGWMLGLVVTP